jgi:predicted enzyme related to lactoylglutathione lyase
MSTISSYVNGTPCWVDLGTPDVAASVAFYKALFGWEIEVGPAEMGHYSMATLKGQNVAAIADQQTPGQVYWTTYLAADDVDATIEKARAAGGNVLVEPMDVMTFGRMAVTTDPGGAAVSFWQAGDHKGAGIVNEAGTVCWNELATRAVDESLAFYEAVAGLHGDRQEFGDSGYYELQLPSGRRVGGLMPMVGDMWEGVPNHWMVYFAVDDTDATAARCQELGGQVQVPPTDIPPGRFALLSDPQGGHFSVIKLIAADPTE